MTGECAEEESSAPGRDGLKTRDLAVSNIRPETLAGAVKNFASARDLLRNPHVLQEGAGADEIDRSRPEDVSLFYIDGEEHRQRRNAIAPFFTLKAIEERYRPIMEATAERIAAEISQGGETRLDKLAFKFAVAVAAEILGLDYSDLEGLTSRIEATINQDDKSLNPMKELGDSAVRAFDEIDIMPAIRARRQERRDDVISRLVDAGCSDAFIATEVRAYSFAGMLTTRELIVMCTWYLLDYPQLRQRFLGADRREQLSIIEEILRLEPIVGYIRRRPDTEIELDSGDRLPAGKGITIDVRAANTDEQVTGSCPYAVDPGRNGARAPGSGFMSFGDGPHRCPGAQLALAEARSFLDRIIGLEGLRFVKEPRVAWFRPIASYVFLEAAVTCDER